MNYLISVENLKKKGLIHTNTDTKLLTICIKRVQDMVIQPCLGSPLYRELLRRVEANDWNADYRNLMNNYVLDALTSAVDAMLVKVGTDKLTNKGAVTVNDENATPLSRTELNQFKDELDAHSFFYLERLIGFLKDDCGTLYPEYTQAITRTNHDLKKQTKGTRTNWIV